MFIVRVDTVYLALEPGGVWYNTSVRGETKQANPGQVTFNDFYLKLEM